MRSILIRSILFRGVLVLSALGAQSALASSPKTSDAGWLKKVPGYTIPAGFKFNDDYVFLTQDQQKELLAAAHKEAVRKVANDDSGEKISESEESPKLRAFIRDFTNVRTAQALDDLITRADNEADSKDTPDDLKFYMAQLAPMKASRGWLYKIRPFLDDSRVLRPHSVRNALVTTGKLFAAFQYVLFPNTQWDAGYEYVTSPDEADVSVIRTPLELQNYAASKVLPRLVTAASRLQKLADTKSEIIWDQKVVFGKFRDDGVGRFRIVKSGNIHALLSAYNLAISNLLYSYCYNIDGIVEVLDDFNDKLVIGSLRPEAAGASAKDRVQILRKSDPNFLIRKNDADIRKNVGKSMQNIMEESKAHLLEAIAEGEIAYESLRDSKEGSFDFIAPGAVRPYQTILNKSFKTAKAMWSQENYPVTSDATGDVLISSLPKFFSEPPLNLKDFAPEPPADSAEFLPMKWGTVKDSKGQDAKVRYQVRNFRAGSATNWTLSKYQPYFPQITNQGIPKATQIMSQTWGAANLFLFVQ